MLVFVTSLRHPDNATDYSFNERLLQKTLSSIEAQTSDDYHVFIVGNKRPLFTMPPKVEFIEVDFEPPVAVRGVHADRSGFVRDKGSKIGVGLMAAKKLSPTWVMIFDADDFVHRDLVRYVHQPSETEGWVIREGWIYSKSRNGYRRQNDFNRTCGTSYVIPFEAYGVPDALPLDASQDSVIDAYGDTLFAIMGAHRNAESWHRERGRLLETLPFRAAVYNVDTGENHSGKELAGLIRPWSVTLRGDFAIESSGATLRTVWRCWGPRASIQEVARLARRGARRIRGAARAAGSRAGRSRA